MNGKSINRKALSLLCAAVLLCMAAIGTAQPVQAADDGGWSVSKAKYSFLTSGQKKIFNKSVKKLKGVSYKPVALLAKQTVAGTNYVYLCQGTTTSARPAKAWYVLTASKDLKKKVTLRSVKKINIAKIRTAKDPRGETLSGGLEIAAVKNKTAALPKAARKAYKKAIKKYTGFELRPIALLGTQVVAGTNYRILCYGSNNTTKELFVVDVNKDTSGKCTIASCRPLKLEKYTD